MALKRAFSIIFFISFLLIVPIAYGHGSLIFEFAPDISNPLQIGSVQTPSQPFIVTNDVISGIDLWVENVGAPASLTVELRNENNILLASRAVTVPTTPSVWAGTRFHIDFNNQIAINALEIYRLQFVSSSPTLALYYSDRAQILQHNAPYIPASLTLPAMLGQQNQEFTFKYALYETQETISPVITNATTTIISPTSVRIDFHANEPVDARATYTSSNGTENTSYTNSYVSCGQDATPCSLTITTIADTSYTYILTAKDVWGNEGNATGDFVTPAGPPPSGGSSSSGGSTNPPPPGGGSTNPPPPAGGDTTPPTILNAHVVGTTDHSVMVAWETNEAANTKLIILKNNAIIQTFTDNTLELEHVATVNGLIPETSYTAVASSADAANNTTSLSLSFTTNAPSSGGSTPPPSGGSTPGGGTTPPAGPPPPAGGSSPPSGPPSSGNSGGSPPPQDNTPPITATVVTQANSAGGGATVLLTWNNTTITNEESYRVDVFDSQHGLAQQFTLGKGSASTTIEGLAPGTYTVIVYAKRNGVFEKIAPPVIFTIRGPSSFSVQARIWFTIILFGLIIGTGSLIFIIVRRKKTKKGAPPPQQFLVQ